MRAKSRPWIVQNHETKMESCSTSSNSLPSRVSISSLWHNTSKWCMLRKILEWNNTPPPGKLDMTSSFYMKFYLETVILLLKQSFLGTHATRGASAFKMYNHERTWAQPGGHGYNLLWELQLNSMILWQLKYEIIERVILREVSDFTRVSEG